MSAAGCCENINFGIGWNPLGLRHPQKSKDSAKRVIKLAVSCLELQKGEGEASVMPLS